MSEIIFLLKEILGELKSLKEEVRQFKSSPPQPLAVEVEKEIFYLGSVVKGFFAQEYATKEYEENGSLYRFEKKTDEAKALFYVVEDKPAVLRRFVNNPEAQCSAVEEVHEYRHNENAKGLRNAQPGEAVLEGEKWRVVRKVQVRYVVE